GRLSLSFPEARMKLVATDAGPFEREAWVESVVIAPAERYVVDVRFDRTGEFALLNKVIGLDHLFGRFFPMVDTLGRVTVVAARVHRDLSKAFVALRRLPPPFAAARSFLNRPPDQTLVLTLRTQRLPFVTER